jgi:O-antigen/teichoic acid export membrane protein
MSTPRSVFKGTVALLAARVGYMGGSMLLVYFLSRLLQAEGLGVYSTAMALFGLGELVCELGLSNFIPRELAKDLTQTNRYLIHSGILVLVTASVTTIVLVGIVPYLGYSDETVVSVTLVSLALLPTSLRVIVGSIFVCHQRVEFETFTTLFWTTIRILISLYLLQQGYGVATVVLAFAVTTWLSFLMSLLFYTRYIGKLRWEFDFAFLKSLVRNLRTFVVLAIGGSIFANAETVILSLLSSETEVGFYSAAFKLITLWYIIPQSYMVVVFPVLTQAYQQPSQRPQAIQEKSIKYLLAVALPLAAGGFAAAQPIIDWFYGPGFEQSVIVFRVIAWHTVLAFVNNVLWRILLARDEQRLALRVQVISGFARVGLSLLLASWLGALGAALALMGGYTLYTLLHLYYLRRGGVQIPFVRLGWRFGLAAGVMGAFTLAFAQHLNLFLLIFVAVLIYAGLVLLLRAFSREDLDLFRQVWRQRGSGGMPGPKTATIDH